MSKEGIVYERVNEPEKIEILSEDRVIPPSLLQSFYSDGFAPDMVAPAGTILLDGRIILPEESFESDYVPYKDENGNIVEGLYTRIDLVRVIKNPFGKPVAKVNPNNFVISEGDIDCYIVESDNSNRFGYDFITEEELNRYYRPQKLSKQLLKNNNPHV